MNIDCEGAHEGQIKRLCGLRPIATGDGVDIGGISEEAQWTLDNYKEPDVRTVMTSIIFFVLGYDHIRIFCI